MKSKKGSCLYEDFTLEGFFTVSLVALYFFPSTVGIFYSFEDPDWFVLSEFWWFCAKAYSILWIVSFLFLCLLPTLLDRYVWS
jgi:hypothetical protein